MCCEIQTVNMAIEVLKEYARESRLKKYVYDATESERLPLHIWIGDLDSFYSQIFIN